MSDTILNLFQQENTLHNSLTTYCPEPSLHGSGNCRSRVYQLTEVWDNRLKLPAVTKEKDFKSVKWQELQLQLYIVYATDEQETTRLSYRYTLYQNHIYIYISIEKYILEHF